MRRRSYAPALAALTLVAAACGDGGERGSGPAAREPVPVDTVRVETTTRAAESALPGVVRPAERARLATRHAGTVTDVGVAAGDAVEAGGEILAIDARDLEAARAAARLEVEAARTAFETAARNRDRFRRLHEQRLIARARLEEAEVTADAARGRLARARAELDALNVELDYTTLRAPFDGVVAEVLAETGTFAQPGRPLVVFEDRSRLEIDAVVDQATAAGIAPSDRVRVRVQGGLRDVAGRVIAVLPALRGDAVGLRLRVAVVDPPAGVVPGMVAEVVVTGAPEAQIRVPAAALLRRGQLAGVFVIESADGAQPRARLRWVDVAPDRPGADDVRVLEGLSPGERIVVGAPHGLADGDPVLISP